MAMFIPMEEKPSVVVVPIKRYNELRTVEKKLNALECAGVDNWEGYSEAMREFYADEDEEED
jgi:hypothetical protein